MWIYLHAAGALGTPKSRERHSGGAGPERVPAPVIAEELPPGALHVVIDLPVPAQAAPAPPSVWNAATSPGRVAKKRPIRGGSPRPPEAAAAGGAAVRRAARPRVVRIRQQLSRLWPGEMLCQQLRAEDQHQKTAPAPARTSSAGPSHPARGCPPPPSGGSRGTLPRPERDEARGLNPHQRGEQWRTTTSSNGRNTWETSFGCLMLTIEEKEGEGSASSRG